MRAAPDLFALWYYHFPQVSLAPGGSCPTSRPASAHLRIAWMTFRIVPPCASRRQKATRNVCWPDVVDLGPDGRHQISALIIAPFPVIQNVHFSGARLMHAPLCLVRRCAASGGSWHRPRRIKRAILPVASRKSLFFGVSTKRLDRWPSSIACHRWRPCAGMALFVFNWTDPAKVEPLADSAERPLKHARPSA